jgi:hypothetical protein
MKNNRRTWLTQISKAAALGLLGPAGISSLIQDALAKGDVPTINGVNTLTGSITINGQAAKVGTLVKLGDKVVTGNDRGTIAVIVIGKDAYLLRESTSVIFEENRSSPGALERILIESGKILSVFAKRPPDRSVRLRAQSATIGIRGTGCYIEAYPTRTYFCLCYGEATVDAPNMATRNVKAQHHDEPMWLDESNGNMKIETTKFGSHTDDELILLEKLVGRVPPFVALGLTGKYGG